VTDSDQARERYHAEGRAELYLNPGELAAPHAPTAVKTILGSCVAICLWDAGMKVGGINHFLLPHGRVGGRDEMRYANGAFARLVDALAAAGGRRGQLRAKLFGGASVLTGPLGSPLGDSNIQAAERLLGASGIPILSRDVGGQRGRRLVFHTDTADVWVWRL
jgi:chemotaxis protein CheD